MALPGMTSSGTAAEYGMILWSGRRHPGMVAAPARAIDAPISFMKSRRLDESNSDAPPGNSRSTKSRNPSESANSSTLRQ